MIKTEPAEILNTVTFNRENAIALLSGLSTAVAIFHAEKLEILWSNKSFQSQTLIKKTVKQRSHKSSKILVTDLFPESDSAAVLGLIAIAQETGYSFDTERSLLKAKVGRFPAKISFFRFDTENRDWICFEFTDLSLTQMYRELTEKEVHLRHTQEELVNAAKWASLGKLAGGIAHEINNPLAIIKGRVSQLLKLVEMKKADLDTMQNLQSRIDTAISRISQLTYGLLSVSQTGTPDSQTIERAEELIAAAVRPFATRCASLGLEIGTEKTRSFSIGDRSDTKSSEQAAESTEDHETCVLVNAGQIQRVLMCLIENAIDSLEQPEGVQFRVAPKITIEFGKKDSRVVFKVKDNGKGISREHAKDIFEPFFTTKPLGKGTGLNLSLALRIAECHGGSLKYSSEPGQTVFTLELPLARPLPLASNQ